MVIMKSKLHKKFLDRTATSAYYYSATHVSARLAQSVEHETLNLRVVGSSPTLGDNFSLFCFCIQKPLSTFFAEQNLPREGWTHAQYM